MLDEVAAGVGVIFLKRLEDVLKCHIVRKQPLGLDDDLILLHQAAERIHVGDSRHRPEDWAHNVILERAQFGRVIVGIITDKRVLKNLA